MKNIKLFSIILIAIFSATSTFAQVDQDLDEAGNVIGGDATTVDESMYVDDIVKRRLITENRVLPYEPIREADIAWEKRIWRVIDTREKMNMSFRDPLKPFFNILQEMLANGDVVAFQDEEFKEPMTIDEVNGKMNDLDTIVDYDPETYEEKIVVVQNVVNWEDIKRFRVKEIWYFDEEASKMDVRILGIAPIREKYDENDVFIGNQVLFWVYYPEAREALSKHRVFNDFNDIAPMTWNDLFESRFFASYIYKKSNTLDLRLEDQWFGYDHAGIDRLLESEKIKQELFNFEHDLWTY